MTTTGWDEGLSEREITKIDEEFLGGRPPGRHFRGRLRLLMKALDQEVDERRSVTYGRLTVTAEEDDDEVFAHLEAAALFHQLTEAAWSLLFAAAPDVRSPSLFLAQLKTQEFREGLIEARADPDQLDGLLRYALQPRETTSSDAHSVDGAQLERNVRAARRIMSLAADRLLVDRRVNNAIKHGFAVTTPRAQLGVTLDDPRLLPNQPQHLELSRSAVWLAVLERLEPDPAGRRPWTRTLTALDDLDQEFWLIELLSRLVDGFWSCAGARRGYVEHADLVLPDYQDAAGVTDRPADRLRKVTFNNLYSNRPESISMTFYVGQKSTDNLP